MQRFYGASEWPGGWWHVPIRLLKFYLRQMPVIQAKEDLRLIRALWATSESHSEDAADAKNDYIEELEDDSMRPEEKEAQRKLKILQRNLSGGLTNSPIPVIQETILGLRPGQASAPPPTSHEPAPEPQS